MHFPSFELGPVSQQVAHGRSFHARQELSAISDEIILHILHILYILHILHILGILHVLHILHILDILQLLYILHILHFLHNSKHIHQRWIKYPNQQQGRQLLTWVDFEQTTP